MPDGLNIAVFASGKGSNFRSLLGAIDSGTIPNTRIALLVSNNPKAGALETARDKGIPVLRISLDQFTTEEEYCSTLIEALRKDRVNFIALAGYMKKLSPRLISRYRNRIVNIHPALLPAFGGPGMYGKHVHEAVLGAGATVTGATVHFVDEDYDHGPIILQRSIPVQPSDTPETLAARVLTLEHDLYPEAIRLIAEGKVLVDAQHVTIMNSG